MYRLNPIRIYMLDRVQDNPAWVATMNRIVDAVEPQSRDIVRVTEQNLPDVVAEIEGQWPPDVVPPGRERTFMRPLVFTPQELTDDVPDLDSLLERCPEGTSPGLVRAMFGQFEHLRLSHPREEDAAMDRVCWPTYDFGAMTGCPHGCLYCGHGRVGKAITIAVNIEEYVEQVVGPTIEQHSWQKCFRMIGWGADMIAFEPEYGLFDLFTRKLAQHDRYGYFHTASANVDWMADLPHRDRLIGVWSVSCDGVARQIEPGAGPAVERFEAARKCQDVGIPVRFKFKPMIPIRNWRQEYARAIEDALKRTRPESIGFCVVMWMDYESLVRIIPPDLLDPEYLAAAQEAAGELKGVKTGPFPHAVRAEIYRFLIEQVRRWDKDVPLYVSTESRAMWDELKDDLGQDPRAYVCGCSPVAVPGRGLALSPGCPHSTYSPMAS